MIYLNGYDVNLTIFPDKTSQVWQLYGEALASRDMHTIEWIFESEKEIMHLMQLVKLVRSTHDSVDIKLVVDYLPYGRQDKDVGNDQTFALHVLADIINSLRFTVVETVDAHSPKTSLLFRNLVNVTRSACMYEAVASTNANTIVYPDQGAYNRYHEDYKMFHDMGVIRGQKTRDPLTGRVVTSGIIVETPNYEAPYMMIDDICDGGATFIGLAQYMIKVGANPMDINLYVSHGIFSKGVNVLFDAGINRIFTSQGEQNRDD